MVLSKPRPKSIQCILDSTYTLRINKESIEVSEI